MRLGGSDVEGNTCEYVGRVRSGRDMASRSLRPRGRLLCALAGDFPREGSMSSGPEAEPDRRRAGGMIIQWRRLAARDRALQRYCVERRRRRRSKSAETAPNALERMTSRRTRASGPRSSQVAADMVLAFLRACAGAGVGWRQSFRGSRRTPRRRGGGTLLGGFVWTRVDAADARIPPLSVFSGGAKCQS